MNTNYSSRKKQCLQYFLTPYMFAVRVFAMDFVFPCRCYENLYSNNQSFNFYSIYRFIVELFMWSFVIKTLSMIFISNATCGSAFHLFPDHPKYLATLLLILSLYHAMQLKLVNRKKISVCLLKISYKDEMKWIEKIQYYMLFFLSVYLQFTVVWSFLTVLVYSKLRNAGETEAMLCTLWLSTWFFYANGQVVSLLAHSSVVLLIIGKRLIHLSNELAEKRSNDRSLKMYLEDLIDDHSEIWEFFQHVNDRWEFFMPMLYAMFMNISSFVLYAVIFIKMDFALKLSFAFLATFTPLLCVFTSWTMCVLTSLLYDNFIAVSKFSESNLKLEYKYKVIDFMKRFEGIPIGISMAGFFTIKKDFVIRMISGMYSAFSTLIELTGVLSSKKHCTSNITGSNNF